ncbi:hypothetical protein GCM10023083_35450 [Streptomyces phyllanthi]
MVTRRAWDWYSWPSMKIDTGTPWAVEPVWVMKCAFLARAAGRAGVVLVLPVWHLRRIKDNTPDACTAIHMRDSLTVVGSHK